MSGMIGGRRLLAALTALTLSLGSGWGAVPALAGSDTAPYTSARAAAAGILSPEVGAALSVDGPGDFLVRFRQVADVETAATAGEAAAVNQATAKGQALTPAAARSARRTAVVASLLTTSRTNGTAVAPLLDRLRAQGQVVATRDLWAVGGLAVTGTLEAAQALAAHPAVAAVLPDRELHLDLPEAVPAQPGAGPGLAATEWNIDQIDAPAAWALGIDGTGAVVGNIDTGVAWQHPALQRKYRGFDPANPGQPQHAGNWFDATPAARPAPYDDNDHGTHTMGTAVGSDPDDTNQVGVAPGARWIAAKAFSAGGSAQSSWLLAAGQWMLAPTDAAGNPHPEWAPDVVNNSWGGGPGIDDWYRELVRSWRAAGIFPAFAAGNSGPSGGSVGVPGNYPESFAVGAVDRNGALAGFSSRGPSAYGVVKPEVAAPGVAVRSAVANGTYSAFSGTSMATPHVAGTVALIRSANQSLTVEDIEAILKETAAPATDATFTNVPNNGFGFGRLNAFDAVSAVAIGRGAVSGRVVQAGDDLQAPTVTHEPVSESFQGLRIPITAHVTDNTSVVAVSLYARTVGQEFFTEVPMRRVSGDFRDGVWSGAIPGYLVTTAGVEYYLRAVDFGNTPVTNPPQVTRPHRITISRGLVPGTFNDFEATPRGFASGGDNDSWQWGAPASGPGAAFSGQNLWATNLAGNYPDNANAFLMVPPVDLTESTAARLQWRQWFDLETCCDFADVFASTDGQNWTRLQRFRGNSAGNWQAASVDLTPFAGQVVFVLFNLLTDGSVTRPGWYLDDLAVLGPDTAGPVAPADLTGTADGLGEVQLQWQPAPDPDLAEYRIYRSATPGTGHVLVGQTGTPAFLDAGAAAGSVSYYQVTGVDVWGNEGLPSAEVAVMVPPVTAVFNDDMEAGPGLWAHGGTGDVWAHGAPVAAAGGPEVAFSGTNLWGTGLDGSYPNGADAWLLTPPLDLTGHSQAALRFAQWYDVELGFDRAQVEVSADGGATWDVLAIYTGASDGWQRPSFSLDAYAGQTIQVRFRLVTDGSVVDPGWYVDDVRVLAAPGTTASLAPTVKPVPKGYEDQGPRVGPGLGIAADEVAAAAALGEITGPPAPTALPVLDATVTVSETGRSVRTDPATGLFRLAHAAGAYTLVAEAYGYFPQQQSVTIADGAEVQTAFVLEPIPSGRITGILRNARTGAPVPRARVAVAEDPRVPSVTTGDDGRFELSVLQGEYTLQIRSADFHPVDQPVIVTGGSNAEVTVDLQPFIGRDDALAFDDGTPEDAFAFFEAGNGWAVKFNLAEGVTAGKLLAALFRFWDNTWPEPGGTAIRVAIYDASGPDGAPGKVLAGPLDAVARRDGSWTEVDLSHLGIDLPSEFFVAYIQADAFPRVPGLGVDQSTTPSGRNWFLVGGEWTQAPLAEGNRMIRAAVLYPVAPPAIHSPADGAFTNQPEVPVTGTAEPGATVTVIQNGTPAATAIAAADGSFSAPVILAPGANDLAATATVPRGTTDPSPPRRIFLDQVPPGLAVSSPTDGLKTNLETIAIAGSSTDDLALNTVTINGQAVKVETDGAFRHAVVLSPGLNTFTIAATDRAGNVTERTVTIDVNRQVPLIDAPQPAADITLYTGDTLKVGFTSVAGAQSARSRLVLPTGNGTAGEADAASGDAAPADVAPAPDFAMEEVAAGVYEGTWIVPSATAFAGARLELQVVDAYGNESTVFAPGRITVIADLRPEAHITLPTDRRAGRDLEFSGEESTDADGRIDSYHWDFGDGTTATGSRPRHRFAAPGTYTVVLTVTDDLGATGVTRAEFTVGSR